MTTVDRIELSEITCDGEGFELMADLIMALAEGRAWEAEKAVAKLKELAKARYSELSGEKEADEARAQAEYDDYVASVHHAAAA